MDSSSGRHMRMAALALLAVQVVLGILFLFGPDGQPVVWWLCLLSGSFSSLFIFRRFRRNSFTRTVFAGFAGAWAMFFVLGFAVTFRPMPEGMVHKWGQSIESGIMVGLLAGFTAGVCGALLGVIVSGIESICTKRRMQA
jgi:hypothetical protein